MLTLNIQFPPVFLIESIPNFETAPIRSRLLRGSRSGFLKNKVEIFEIDLVRESSLVCPIIPTIQIKNEILLENKIHLILF